MDNLTHSLTGLALSRAGLDRFSPRAVWLLVLSANAPDLDIAAATKGAFRYLEMHRGYTHSLLGLPLLAMLPVVLVAAIFRERLPWLRAWLICIIGLASHLLLDWTNSYGVRFLIPFSPRWFHLDVNSLYDGWILAVLMFAAIWPFFARLVNREIGASASIKGRRIATFALIFFLLFDLGRATLHNRVVAQLESRLYDGFPPVRAAALPDAFNPLKWTAIVETDSTYRMAQLNALEQLNPEGSSIYYKPQASTGLAHARSTDPFRYFLYFARFPVWSLQPVIGEHTRGTRLDLTDLRFGVPNAGSFHCVGYENDRGELLEKRFTYGSGANLGWNGEHGSPVEE